MKYIYIAIALIMSEFCFSQIAIGKSSVDGDGLLDFVSGTTKGIILPKVESLNNQVGSLVFDTSDNKVKYNNGSWVDLSINSGTSDITNQSSYTERGGGTIIGSDTSSAEGVLILESSDKALILPKIASPHLNVKSPSPGMICYDTDKDLLAIYNGIQWAFWTVN